MEGSDRQRLDGLDALRGVAALLVLWHHVNFVYGFADPLPLAGRAVDLFFCLSGFVMARTYEHRFREGLSPPTFMLMRYKRLWMPALAGATLGLGAVLLSGFSNANVWLSFVFHALMLPTFWLRTTFPMNGPYWSLFVELAMNLLHATVLFRVVRLKLVLALVGSFYLASIFMLGVDETAGTLSNLPTALTRGLTCYVIGVLIFRTYGSTPLAINPWAIVLLWPAATAAVQYALPYEWSIVAFTAALPLIIRGSLGLGQYPAFTALGALSYPLYAVHMPILLMLPANPLLAVAIALGLASLLAGLFAWRKPLRLVMGQPISR